MADLNTTDRSPLSSGATADPQSMSSAESQTRDSRENGRHFSPHASSQFAAIVLARWRTILHSLRTTRGSVNLVSHLILGLMITLAGVGGAFGLGGTAWYFVSNGHTAWVALLLWSVFTFWQMFPILGTAFTQNIDSSDLLRFPLSYRAYFVIRLIYGVVDIATALGTLWLLGIFIGIALANPRFTAWAALVLAVFGLINVLLARTIFAWIERWLAQRRTREFLGILFFLMIIGFQFIGPVIQRYGDHPRPEAVRIAGELSPIQRILPAGLAGAALARAADMRLFAGVGYLALLVLYGVLFVALLHIRLRAQYLGENLSEESRAVNSSLPAEELRPGWRLPGVPGPIAAMVEKELRYLSRSGPMLFTLIMPAFMMVVFRMGQPRGGFLRRSPDLAFPIGAAYALLMLTNMIYNNFGNDSGGLQFYLASPVRIRNVVLAKNAAHMTVFALELLLVWVACIFMYYRPGLEVSIATLTGVVFALALNLAAGNLLSVYWPKRVEYAVFGRQRASQATVLTSFGIQFGIFGAGSLVLWLAYVRGSLWIASLIFLVLDAIAIAIYLFALGRVDRLAMNQRETLVSELCKV